MGSLRAGQLVIYNYYDILRENNEYLVIGSKFPFFSICYNKSSPSYVFPAGVMYGSCIISNVILQHKKSGISKFVLKTFSYTFYNLINKIFTLYIFSYFSDFDKFGSFSIYS